MSRKYRPKFKGQRNSRSYFSNPVDRELTQPKCFQQFENPRLFISPETRNCTKSQRETVCTTSLTQEHCVQNQSESLPKYSENSEKKDKIKVEMNKPQKLKRLKFVKLRKMVIIFRNFV